MVIIFFGAKLLTTYAKRPHKCDLFCEITNVFIVDE